MGFKKVLFIAAGSAACAAWFSAAMTPRTPLPVVEREGATRTIETGAALAREIARLHERLRPDAAPSPDARNLFAFRASRAVRAVAAPPSMSPVAAAPQPAAAPDLGLRLSGLAEDHAGTDGAHDVARTAIITGRGQVFLVQAGETLTVDGVTYTVGRIDADGVDLTDQRDSRSRRLVLK
ncbi:MAG: hypothetical protein ABUS56_04075 [Acidobacteriota bacterium]